MPTTFLTPDQVDLLQSIARAILVNGEIPQRVNAIRCAKVPPWETGRKINMIKLVRSLTNAGLKEAKEFVEEQGSTCRLMVPVDTAKEQVRQEGFQDYIEFIWMA